MSDLRKLSEAATPGEWYSCHVQGWGFPESCSMIAARDHAAKTIAGDCPVAIFQGGAAHWETPWPHRANRDYVAALVKAHRDGSLIPRSKYERVLALLAEAREALLGRDGGAHDTDCRSQRLYQGVPQLACNCGHDAVRAALSRIDDALAAEPEARA